MRKDLTILSIAFLILLCLTATRARGADDIAAHRSCSQCGMDRKAFGYSRMLVEYKDGSGTGVCSLHCAFAHVKRKGLETVSAMLVADRDSRELIDARSAVWVMGGDRKGVMTFTPKWAFAGRPAADRFVNRHGGRIVTFEEVWEAARKEAAE